MAVYLIRHTQPDVPEGVCYGQLDIGLAKSFEREAANVLKALPPITNIVTSPLTRCRRLAQHLSQATSAPVAVEPQLAEMDFGHWEGRTWDAIAREEIDAWANDFWNARPHGGESVAQLKARTDDALQALSARAGAVAVVTHAGVIKAAFAAEPSAESYNRSVAFGEIAAWPQ